MFESFKNKLNLKDDPVQFPEKVSRNLINSHLIICFDVTHIVVGKFFGKNYFYHSDFQRCPLLFRSLLQLSRVNFEIKNKSLVWQQQLEGCRISNYKPSV